MVVVRSPLVLLSSDSYKNNFSCKNASSRNGLVGICHPALSNWRARNINMAEEQLESSKAEIFNHKNVDDEDSGITMVDVLEEEKELEDDANAVLGGSDDQNCTYPQGYVKRQALYACKTCAADNGAGICLACSYACHEGHELVELYTKRNFCCDCGNQKFPNNPCKLYPNKASLNPRNTYNQNFNGVYCTCSRPYPDPEVEVEDEMIQCIICEDWYHGRHLGCNVPNGDDYEEMICKDCMSKNELLWPYAFLAVGIKMESEDSNDSVLDGGAQDVSVDVEGSSGNESNSFGGAEGKSEIVPVDVEGSSEKDSVATSSFSEDDSAIFSDSSNFACKLRHSKQAVKAIRSTSFWPAGWREKICSCEKCKSALKEKGLHFLLDLQDTVHSYEEKGKEKESGQSQYDKGMQALSQLDRVRQVQAIHEYNSMKSQLKKYLKDFAEKKKVVRKEDIEEFFTQMQARKRRRLNVNVPQFCR